MPRKAFKDLSLKRQMRVCDQKINYWMQMRKKLSAKVRARTPEEKAAITAELDLDLSNDPTTEEDEA